VGNNKFITCYLKVGIQ